MLEFIEDTHTYKLDGQEIPSVSEITRFISRELYKESDPCAMEVAADRGTRVHRACEEIDRTGLTECDPNILQYLSAYTKFLKEHDVKWEKIEEPFWTCIPYFNLDGWTSQYRYAGTVDRYGTVDGQKMLIDIKTTKRITGKHKLQYGTQLAAYKFGLDETRKVKAAILQLTDEGEYKLIDMTDSLPDACMRFDACLTLHYAFEGTKRKGKRKNG